MPRKAKYESIQARYFRWRIMPKRYGVWYADGRSNQPSVGRHSLGTKNKDEAFRLLHQLDAKMAVRQGLADPAILEADRGESLTIMEGAEAYLQHVGRPTVAGGASKSTLKRYKPVFDKFTRYATDEGVQTWDSVSKRLVEGYASWLDDNGYAYRTEYLELTTIKQAIHWLADEGLIPVRCIFKLPLQKPDGSPTYCYSQAEVRAMISYCAAAPKLLWLGRVICTLAYTGMRIGELAQLEWRDIDLDDGVIHVRDESRGATRRGDNGDRTTKSRRSRVVPIHRDLRRAFGELDPDRQGRVFLGPLGGKLKPDTVRNVLTREVLPSVARRLYPKNPSPAMLRGRVHSLRHTFCTLAYRAGWQERTILDVMGHTDSAVTQLYRHLAWDEYREAIDHFDSLDGVDDDIAN